MIDTPMTDLELAANGRHQFDVDYVRVDFARKLERELSEAYRLAVQPAKDIAAFEECKHVTCADVNKLIEDRAMLMEALRRIDRLNVHTGDGPHCTCCQGAREITVSDALRSVGTWALTVRDK